MKNNKTQYEKDKVLDHRIINIPASLFANSALVSNDKEISCYNPKGINECGTCLSCIITQNALSKNII